MTVFDEITLFPQEIANLKCFDSICLVPNRIDYVLPRWRDNLLSISQLLRDNKLSPKAFSVVLCVFLILTGQRRQHRVFSYYYHFGDICRPNGRGRLIAKVLSQRIQNVLSYRSTCLTFPYMTKTLVGPRLHINTGHVLQLVFYFRSTPGRTKNTVLQKDIIKRSIHWANVNFPLLVHNLVKSKMAATSPMK